MGFEAFVVVSFAWLRKRDVTNPCLFGCPCVFCFQIWALETIPAAAADQVAGHSENDSDDENASERKDLPRIITGASDSALKIWFVPAHT